MPRRRDVRSPIAAGTLISQEIFVPKGLRAPVVIWRLLTARRILLSWAGAISEGMVPNRFPDHGEQPEFNSVDASLGYVVAAHEFLTIASRSNFPLISAEREFLHGAIGAILESYSRGTRHRIGMTDDGLLAAGEPGVQLTWMDAKVGDWVVTPRIGKPVEIQALWLNALWAGAQVAPTRWPPLLNRALASFHSRFWNEELDCLFDVIEVDHQAGRIDATIRPNQIFAVGGLPFVPLTGERARKVFDRVERDPLTPLGLRSVQGSTVANRATARERFLKPLFAHLDVAGLGHVSEIADGAAPHLPRGCPWQACSLRELLRTTTVVLAEPSPSATASPASSNRSSRRKRELMPV